MISILLIVHDVKPYTSTQFNMTHKIRHLSFGLNIPGKTNPMDDTTVVAMEGMKLFIKKLTEYLDTTLFCILNLQHISLQILASYSASYGHECSECSTTLNHRFSNVVYQFPSS